MSTATAETGNVAGELPLDLIAPEHWPNPRGAVDTTSAKYAELKASIEAQGILEPIVIGPPLLELDGRHAIVAGWRRYTVAAELGLQTVPVHQKIEITDARLALRAALAENMAREDMTPLAEAQAIARLVELGDTQVQAATAVGVSERTARERLRLLTLPAAVRDAIAERKVPSTAGRQLQLIAVASPAVAVAIAEGLEQGHVRVADLLDPDLTADMLMQVAGDVDAPFEPLNTYIYVGDIDDKALGKRLKAAGSHIRLTAPDELIDAARQTGSLLELDAGQDGSPTIFLTDGDLIHEALEHSIELAEKANADRKAELQRLGAKNATAEGQDPAERARREHAELAAAVDQRAQPYAAAMNAELGRRLRGMRSCTIEGPVARLVLHLVDAYVSVKQVAVHGYKHVDPDHKLPDDWADCDPEQAAAELVKAYTAATFCDPRAGGDELAMPYFLRQLPNDLVRAAAVALKLLPDRALKLADARVQLDERQAYHDLRRERRRILFELGKASKGGLEREALRDRAKEFGRDAGELVDVAVQVYGTQNFVAALEQLEQAGHVKAVKSEDKQGVIHTRYTTTPDGRKALKAPPDPAPIIDDLDADASLPEGTPATDELQDDATDLMSRLAPGSRRATALELVGAQPGITIPELAERMGLKQNTLYRLLPELQDDGLVRKDGRGWHPAEPVAEASA